MTGVLFGLAAAAGAVGRYGLARLTCSWQSLLVVNTVGAALLGWIVARDVSDSTVTIVGVGLCGSLTTFSSFALEVRSLGWKMGFAYGAVTVICATSAASVATTL